MKPPLINRLDPVELDPDVLTAEYYDSADVECESSLRTKFRATMLATVASKMYQGASPRGGVKGSSGMPALKARNLTGHGLGWNVAYVTHEQFRQLSRAHVRTGDVFVLRSAHAREYIGKHCDLFIEDYCPFSVAPLVTEKLIGARIDDQISALFVTAFLRTQWGYRQIQRRLRGISATLTPSNFGKVLIPQPCRELQEYIGTKVELAERCRSRSTSFLSEACSRLDERLRIDDFHPGNVLSNVIMAQSLTGRITGEFYLPRYFALETHLGSLGVPVRPLRSLLRSNIIRSSTPERTEHASVPCILTSDIDPHEIRWRNPSLRVTQAVHDTHSGNLKAHDVVYTSVGPPVGEAAVVLPQFLPMAVGGDVSILRHGTDLHPGFLALYLNSVFGQMQNDRYSRGIRQRRVYPEDIGSFLVPVLSTTDQTYIGERIIRHHMLNEAAVDLVNRAKADVEALLEGTLDVDAILTGSVKAPKADDVAELTEAYT